MEYYLCVLDFEATCWNDTTSRDLMEIIEFPSVLYKVNELTKKCEFISEFSQYVKPTIKPLLSQFCTELTGITQEKVSSAKTIDLVYKEHVEWLNKNVPKGSDFVFATCGAWDLKTQLPREIFNKKLKSNKYYSKYINVKDEYEYFYNIKAKGMVEMLFHLNIPMTGRHHSGIDDTRNIAKIMLKMISDGHKAENYKFNYVRQ